MTSKKPMNPGFTVMLVGFFVAISPIPLALILTLISGAGNMFSEGEGGGAALWFLFFTIPIGFITFIVGIVIAAINAAKNAGRGPASSNADLPPSN